ncbi:GTPase Era, mitochondrial-like [Liolophura sinensis]|uniref:GTPase Era, mitochondrial-like n=1 Tax=Liolophura sinensis TaxID=3198878 RepID=UPI003158AEEE
MAAPMMTGVQHSSSLILRISAYLFVGTSHRMGIKQTVCGCRLLRGVCGYSSRPTNNHIESEVVQGSSQPVGLRTEKGIGLTAGDQTWRTLATPDQPPNSKLLRLAIIGRPNCGKSTLTNQLMGWRVSSVSNKVHTTRKQTLGVWTHNETQLVFLDTPGMVEAIKRHRHHLEKSLLTDPHSSWEDADLVAVVVDVSQPWNRTELDEEILKALYMHSDVPSILVLNKVDKLKEKHVLLSTVRRLTEGIVAGKPVVKKRKEKLTKQDLFESELVGHTKTDSKNRLSGTVTQTSDWFQDSDNGVSSESLSQRTSLRQSEIETAPHLHSQSKSSEEFHQYGDSANVQSEHSPAVQSDASLSSVDHSDGSWIDLHQKLKEVKKVIRKKNGWPNFDHVFMVSALTGDGVKELKDYMLGCAKPSDWLYHSSLVTDQHPQDIAKMCVWEKLLDHLREEIPYNLQLDVSYWEVDPSGRLKLAIDVSCWKKRHFRAAMGPGGSTIRLVSVEAEEELARTFQCPVLLKVRLKLSN